MSDWHKISTMIVILLIGIPTAAEFYPAVFVSLFVTLFGWLPLDLILTVMFYFGVLSLGMLIGWYLHIQYEMGNFPP